MSPSRRTRGRPQRPLTGHVLLDERTERRLRRVRWRRIALALVVVAAVVGAVALYRSPLLRVQQVQVTGTTNVDPAQVAQLADLDGESMLDLPLGIAEERIEMLPLVSSAEAKRSWPQTVRIEVTERLPWGYWKIGDRTYVIDAEGIVLPQVQPAADAPVIEDLGGPVELMPGDPVDVDAVALARWTLEQVPGTLALAVTRLEYTPAAGLTLVTDAGYRVVMGDSQNKAFKLAAWQAVEQELGREAMVGHVLDLRFQDRPSLQ